MNPREVVVDVPNRDHVRVVLDLLRERIGQPGKAAHTHSHVEVLTLDVRGRYMLGIGVARDSLRDRADTGRGAVLRLSKRQSCERSSGSSSPRPARR